MSLTVLLIIITVGLSYYAWQNQSLLYRWMMHPPSIDQRGEYWRFIASGFIHADWGHLIFNMFSFYFFGETMEYTFDSLFGPGMGNAMFLLLYLGGIVVSDLPSYLKNRHNAAYNSLGASGGVSAVIFAGIMFYPLNKICLYAFLCMPGFIFGALYLAYSYYESRRGGSYVNHSAHLWGALFGVGLSIAVFPNVIPRFIAQITGNL